MHKQRARAMMDGRGHVCAQGKPSGVKADGGGSIRGQGRVGSMRLHRAVFNQDAACGCPCMHACMRLIHMRHVAWPPCWNSSIPWMPLTWLSDGST